MDKAAPFPVSLPAASRHEPSDPFGRARLSEFQHARMPPRRSSIPPPLAAPAPPVFQSRALLIEGLRRRVQAIERPRLGDGEAVSRIDGEAVRIGNGEAVGPDESGTAQASRPGPRSGPRSGAWSLGAPRIDGLLGEAALDTAACHEIKPGSGRAGARAAALAFALALARRRLETNGAPDAGPGKGLPRILWCTAQGPDADLGALHAPGLARFGLDASAFLVVEVRRSEEVLWALEEGLRSGSLVLAIGCLDKIGLTPARRLSLAARDGRTPALLLTPARSPPAGATATRWRIDPAASACHAFDARAPGPPRLAVRLERCRSAPPATETSLTLEWSDETRRFRMAAPLADRAPPAAHARRRAG